jgi:hypothetical protein
MSKEREGPKAKHPLPESGGTIRCMFQARDAPENDHRVKTMKRIRSAELGIAAMLLGLCIAIPAAYASALLRRRRTAQGSQVEQGKMSRRLSLQRQQA